MMFTPEAKSETPVSVAQLAPGRAHGPCAAGAERAACCSKVSPRRCTRPRQLEALDPDTQTAGQPLRQLLDQQVARNPKPRARRLPGSIVDGSPKAGADGEQAADEAGHQVLAGTGCDDGVVGPCTPRAVSLEQRISLPVCGLPPPAAWAMGTEVGSRRRLQNCL